LKLATVCIVAISLSRNKGRMSLTKLNEAIIGAPF
jgi:hypothetical protein